MNIFGTWNRKNILHESSDDYELPSNAMNIPEYREHLDEYNAFKYLITKHEINMTLTHEFKLQIDNGYSKETYILSPYDKDKPLKITMLFRYNSYTDDQAALINEFGTTRLPEILHTIVERELSV